MSLSRDILESRLDSIKRRIALGASLNDFDSYGYTPLIMALMTQQPEIAQLLLSKGSDPNKPDIFGQPPLHWAIKMESVPLSQMLLQRSAFPNTVSSYGEPLLVYPLLRKNRELIEILTQAGTDRHCAQDYIFIKYLGHQFELQGFGAYRNYNNLISLVDYQGFRLEFSLPQILRQYENYVELHSEIKRGQQTDLILKTLSQAERLRSLKKALPSDLESSFTHYLGDINLIPMAFDGHAVSLAFSHNVIALCDRAQNRPETVVFYRLPAKLSFEDIKFLLYGKKSAQFWQEFPRLLSLKKIAHLPIPHQKVGNCSWANIEVGPILIQGLLDLESGGFQQSTLLQQWEQWHNWSESSVLKEALLKSEQLSGDRKLCYTMVLLDVLLQRPDLKSYDLLADSVLKAGPIIQRLYEQHQFNKSSYLSSFERLLAHKK